jgi:hypothetical protein
MLNRQKEHKGRYPLKTSYNGGFASKNNLEMTKMRKFKDLCFAEKRGIKETDICRNQYVYRSMCRFRAGTEI